MQRREFLKTAGLLGVLSAMPNLCLRADDSSFPPYRAITHGPLFHWGAYYDQIHFDPSGRFVVGNETAFEGREPTPDDSIKVGFIDTEENDRWTELEETFAWNWQQGAMLQFIPGTECEVIWNNRGEDDFYSVRYDLKTGKRHRLPGPIYALAPNGEFAVHPDFRRLNDTRPGYGYGGILDPNADQMIPETAGIWRMDFATGKREMLFSFADVAAIPRINGEKFPQQVKHWFNHLIVSPDSRRFLFLHRWQREPGSKNWWTRLMTANADGSDIRIVSDDSMVSHLVWRDPEHIIAFARNQSAGDRFYLFDLETGSAQVYGKEIMTVDGHVSYLPGTGNRWILNDTYPNKNRIQTPFLFELATEKKIPLGEFYLPPEYAGQWRCDLHPRASQDGKKVLIDSAHEGGRQIYLIDISNVDLS